MEFKKNCSDPLIAGSGGSRVHHRRSALQEDRQRGGRRHRQAPHGLRLPRPDHVSHQNH